jgi:hypothetical protein
VLGLAPTSAKATGSARTSEFGLALKRAMAETKPTATTALPCSSKLAVYEAQYPFASCADHPRSKPAAQASASEQMRV